MDAILQLDQNILLFIQEYIRHDWMDWFWKGITHLGDFLDSSNDCSTDS